MCTTGELGTVTSVAISQIAFVLLTMPYKFHVPTKQSHLPHLAVYTGRYNRQGACPCNWQFLVLLVLFISKEIFEL